MYYKFWKTQWYDKPINYRKMGLRVNIEAFPRHKFS